MHLYVPVRLIDCAEAPLVNAATAAIASGKHLIGLLHRYEVGLVFARAHSHRLTMRMTQSDQPSTGGAFRDIKS
jgi:hypothetical protein